MGETLNLFLRQIPLVSTAEVELVAVFLCLHTTQDRTELWQFHLAYPMQLVIHLLLFELQLFLVRQILPLAAATYTEVRAEWYRAYITIFYKAYNLTLGKGVLLSTDLHVTHITRHTEGYKYHQVIPVEQTFAFSCHRLYTNALKER